MTSWSDSKRSRSSDLTNKRKFGVCLDTCHLYAAGYDYSTPEKYAAMMQLYDKLVGFKTLKVIRSDQQAQVRRLPRHMPPLRRRVRLLYTRKIRGDDAAL